MVCRCVFVVDAGFQTCVFCGVVASRELDETISPFDQTPVASIRPVYTRKKRFARKILGALLNRIHHNIDGGLLNHVCECTTPEQMFKEIALFPYEKRRPYTNITAYWLAAGKHLELPTDGEVRKVIHTFDNIFFAWNRLEIVGPAFPYSVLLQHIVKEGSYGPAMNYLIRFTRRLRCPKRRARYDSLFKQCMKYIQNGQVGRRYKIAGDIRGDGEVGVTEP